MKRSIISAILGATISFASIFNRNVTGPAITAGPMHVRPTTSRKRGLKRVGPKGIKSSNMTRYGAALRNHFDSVNPGAA